MSMRLRALFLFAAAGLATAHCGGSDGPATIGSGAAEGDAAASDAGGGPSPTGDAGGGDGAITLDGAASGPDASDAEAEAGDAAPALLAASVYAHDQSGRVIGEYATDGGVVEELIYLEDRVVATVREGKVFAVQTDQLGAPRAVLSGTTPTWTWDPEPFGATAPNEDPDGDGKRFVFDARFPGQRADAITGLYQNFHRNYAPEWARYVEADPIGLSGGLNLFAYADGQPTHSFDPLGLRAGSPRVVSDARQVAGALANDSIVIAEAAHGVECKSGVGCPKGDFGFYSRRWYFKKDFFWSENVPAAVSAKVFVNLVCYGNNSGMGPRFLQSGGRTFIGADQPSALQTDAVLRLIQAGKTGQELVDELNIAHCRKMNPKATVDECRQHQGGLLAPRWRCQGDCDTPLEGMK